ncbi:MAG: GNAT family N-acetyltransferase [Vicinamibacteraceae bacterium]
MPDADLRVRPATRADLPALGRLGAHLMRVHYEFDRRRFVAPGANTEPGYAHFLGTQLDADDGTVLVAERGGTVVGYVYAGIEPFSWKELREAAGFVHDIVVDAAERRTGVAGALMDAAIAWVRGQGVASVMLWTAAPNEGAQRLFERRGFRRTMIEMTLNL